jgi:adenine phosphoribosyltransferase
MAYSQKVLDFFSKNKVFYSIFLHNTDQKEVASRYISLNLANKNRNKILRFLCIGGGSGDADLSIIKKLKNRNIIIDYVDPSKEMSDEFIRKSKKLKLNRYLGNINIDKFESDTYLPNKADIIFCINSLYFIDNWKKNAKCNSLMKLYDNLNENGLAVIVIRSNESDHTNLKKIVGGGRTTGEVVRRVLNKLKIPYFMEIVPSHINISSCFLDGEFNPDETGKKLMNFIFGNRWNNLEYSKRRKVIRWLQNKTIKMNGKRLIEASHEYIWIYKPDASKEIKKKDLEGREPKRLEAKIRGKIRTVPDFPVEGILFRDTTTLLRDSKLFGDIIQYVNNKIAHKKIKYVVAKDMQGLIWAGAIAQKMSCGIVPMFRKDLAGDIISAQYEHEYNPKRIVNLQKEAISQGDKILLVDYILATGETMRVMTKLIEHLGGKVCGIFVLLELSYLNGRKGLEKYDIYSLVKY